MHQSLSKVILAFACVLPWGALSAQEPTAGEEIDLGLSVNWRGYNIGASAPEEKGNIYAYASTKAGGYSMMYSYPFFNQVDWSFKLPEGNLSGNTDYDAAALETDGRWQMATRQQWQELLDGCDITAYSYNGVTGAMLTSKVNGNSIFLPSTTVGYGTSCCYYTSESNGSAPYTATFSTNAYIPSEVELQEYQMNQKGPWIGLPLRPVCEKYEGEPLEALSLTAEKTEIFAGTSTQLTASSVPADVPMSLSYTSSDESIATVSEKGHVAAPYGTDGGTVTITVTSGEISATIEITVTAVETDPTEEVVDLGLSVEWCSTNLGADESDPCGWLYPFCYYERTVLSNAFSYKFYRQSTSKYDFPEEFFGGNTGYDAVAYNRTRTDYAGERLPSMAEVKELVENCDIHYSFTGDASAPESRTMLFVSKINGKAISFPMSGSSEIIYSGSTNPDKNAAYALYLMSNPVSAECTEITAPWHSYPLRGVVPPSTTPKLKEIELNLTEAEVFVDNTVRLIATPLPVGAELTDLKWTSDNEEVATVAADGTVTGISEGEAVITATSGKISASCTVTVVAVNLADGDYVDMGTDILWSTRELNAPSQADNGSLYYFGNLTPATSIASNQAAWVDPGIDVIGGTEFDPAHVELGNGWRMPTKSELLNLAANCRIEWITYRGHRGVLLTSEINGNRMFCPMPSGTSYVFYMGDALERGNSSDGSPTVPGLYIAVTQASISAVRAWAPRPIRPVNTLLHVGVEGVSTDTEAAEIVAIHSLDGRSISLSAPLTSGIYIITRSNGTTSKQVVK